MACVFMQRVKRMDFLSLTVFCAVAREQSVTRAAALLGRAPSNITTRLRQMEAELGVPLFERQTKRMLLSAQGRIYLEYAQRMLTLAEDAKMAIQPAHTATILRVGAMECTLASRLPVPLARFKAAWPAISVSLTAGPSAQLLRALAAQDLDCALLAQHPGASFPNTLHAQEVPAFEEELQLLCSSGYWAHGAQKVLAVFAPGCSYRAVAEAWLHEHHAGGEGVTLRQVASYHEMFAYTAVGACACIMPASVITLMVLDVTLERTTLCTMPTWLVSRSGFLSTAFAAFSREILA